MTTDEEIDDLARECEEFEYGENAMESDALDRETVQDFSQGYRCQIGTQCFDEENPFN